MRITLYDAGHNLKSDVLLYVTLTDLIRRLATRLLQGDDGSTERVTPGSYGPQQLSFLRAQG